MPADAAAYAQELYSDAACGGWHGVFGDLDRNAA